MSDPKKTQDHIEQTGSSSPKASPSSGDAPDLHASLSGQPVVYMLRCRDDSLYTGWTNDFPRRLAAHQSGKGGKYTRSRLPVTPVYLEPAPDRSAALQREAAIKKLPPLKKRELINSDQNRLQELADQEPLSTDFR